MYVREIKNEDMPTIQVIYAYHVEYGLASWEEVPPDVDELTQRCNSSGVRWAEITLAS